MELLDYGGGNCHTVFHRGSSILLNYHQKSTQVPISPHLIACYFLSLLNYSHPECNIIFCYFQFSNRYVKHLFIACWPFLTHFLEKYLSMFFAHFWITLFVFLLLSWRGGSFIYSNINSLLDTGLEKIFYHYVGHLFSLLIVSFDAQKFKFWCSSISLFLILLSVLLVTHSRN